MTPAFAEWWSKQGIEGYAGIAEIAFIAGQKFQLEADCAVVAGNYQMILDAADEENLGDTFWADDAIRAAFEAKEGKP